MNGKIKPATQSETRIALDAETCHDRMQTAIAAWDAINTPEEAKEYHRWIRLAMDYEKEAFRAMKEYYLLEQTFEPDEDELRHLRNLAIELWVLKDQALREALDAFPAEQ